MAKKARKTLGLVLIFIPRMSNQKSTSTKCQWCGLLMSAKRNKKLLPPTDGKLYPVKIGGKIHNVCSLCIRDLQRNPTLENWLKNSTCDCCSMPAGLVFMGEKVGRLSSKVIDGRKYKLCPVCKANIDKKAYSRFSLFRYKRNKGLPKNHR